MNFLPGFTAGLVLITLSELGDKTFFIGAILAMRHSRRWVLLGVTTALATMTTLSVLLGQIITVFPQQIVQGVVVALFFGFGAKLLFDASRMSSAGSGFSDEEEEALEAVEQRETGVMSWSIGKVVLEAFSLTFVAEWGDRTQIATITLASTHHPYGVLLGAVIGHTLCAAIAVVCGKLIAGRISEQLMTALGGVLFIGFGILAALDRM